MLPLAPQAMKKGAQKAPFLNDSSLVGHDGLEPSTNGLRIRDEGSEPAFSEGFREGDATVRNGWRDCGAIGQSRRSWLGDSVSLQHRLATDVA